MRAIAEPRRRHILSLVRDGELSISVGLDDDMAGHDMHAGGERPGMQVMRINHAARTQQVGADLVEVDAFRRGLQQHVHPSRNKLQGRGRISSAMKTDAMGSANVQPLARMISPATSTATEPRRSPSTSR